MQHSHRLELGEQRKPYMYLGILFVLVLNIILVANVQAQGPVVTIRVLVEQAAWNGCNDTFSLPDIYFEVTINNTLLSTIDDTIESNFSPFTVNKELSRDVNFALGTIPIKLEQWDSDSGLEGDDDKCNIKPGPGEDINLLLNLATCQISGDVSGSCNTTLGFTGTFLFRISVEEAPRDPGLIVRCLHTPIWPQLGDAVTIIAQALDGNANPITAQPVTNIEIWADNTAAPLATSATTPGLVGASIFSVLYTPPSGANELLYRCRVQDDGARVSSGWRRVQIGQPARGRAVSVINTGVSNSNQWC